VLVDPALVATVLGGVDRREVRAAEALGQRDGGAGDEPVVAMDDVGAQALAEPAPGRVHVRVHALHPCDERVEVARHGRLRHAVDVHAAAQLLGDVLAPAAREHVDLDALRDERLGELVNVAREAARHDRRVLPREDEDALGHGRGRAGGSPRS